MNKTRKNYPASFKVKVDLARVKVLYANIGQLSVEREFLVDVSTS